MRYSRVAVLGSSGALLAFFGWALAASGQLEQTAAKNVQADVREIRIRYGVYAPPSTAITVQSNLVQLSVLVRDKAGHLVGGLSQSDFEVLDNGKPQAIAFFSEEKANVPPSTSPEPETVKTSESGTANNEPEPVADGTPARRSVALFIDDTHSMLRALQTTKTAAEKFVETSLQPGTHMSIFTDSGDVTLEFTDKKELLLAAIGKIRLQSRLGAKPVTDCPPLTSYEAFVIVNHLDPRAREVAVNAAVGCFCPPGSDPVQCRTREEDFVDDLSNTIWNQTQHESTDALDVLKIAVQELAKAPGRRLLIILSPGFAAGGMDQRISGIIDTALRNRIVINSLESDGLTTASEAPEGDRADPSVRDIVLPEMMSNVAAATGGRLIRNNNDLTSSLRELASAPDDSYFLGFSPVNRPDDRYHTLKVRLNNGEKLNIQTRAGYFSGSGNKDQETAQQLIDRVAAASSPLEQFPMTVRATPGAAKNGQFPIGVWIRIDAKQLKFAKVNGRSVQQLTFVTVLEDQAGNYLTGRQAVMDLYLKPSTLATLKSKGIKAILSLNAPHGNYRVREVVRELVQNHIAASITTVECQ
ncbi:MAG: VWA domain-containing protein [Candidatus Acidiferrum sp.]